MDEKDLTARIGEPSPPPPPSRPGRFVRWGARGLAGLITVLYWLFALLVLVNFPMFGIGLLLLGGVFTIPKKAQWGESATVG